jgi:DNA-binding GntR family transcriptional regulator
LSQPCNSVARIEPRCGPQGDAVAEGSPMTHPDATLNFAAFDESMLRTGSRADFVFDTLRDAIWDGRIARGVRVREEEIARNLGVSRTPVREALQRLQQRGLLMVGAGRGLVVAELTHHQVLELYGMREILEGSAARFAAQHATETEVAILNRLQRDLRQVKTDPLAIVRLNRQFHQAIYHAAHNQYLVQALESLNDSLALLNHTTFRMPKRRESDEEHRRIVLAIEKHDPDLAEQAARAHICNAQLTRFSRGFVDLPRALERV